MALLNFLMRKYTKINNFFNFYSLPYISNYASFVATEVFCFKEVWQSWCNLGYSRQYPPVPNFHPVAYLADWSCAKIQPSLIAFLVLHSRMVCIKEDQHAVSRVKGFSTSSTTDTTGFISALQLRCLVQDGTSYLQFATWSVFLPFGPSY